MREKKTLLRIEWSLFVNLESPSPTDALCQVWLKLAHPLWRWRFFNFLNVFLLFHYYLHFEKGFALYSPFTHGGFLPSLIKNVTDRQTDGWKAHFRIQLRWAKKPWQNLKSFSSEFQWSYCCTIHYSTKRIQVLKKEGPFPSQKTERSFPEIKKNIKLLWKEGMTYILHVC